MTTTGRVTTPVTPTRKDTPMTNQPTAEQQWGTLRDAVLVAGRAVLLDVAWQHADASESLAKHDGRPFTEEDWYADALRVLKECLAVEAEFGPGDWDVD